MDYTYWSSPFWSALEGDVFPTVLERVRATARFLGGREERLDGDAPDPPS